MDVSMLFNRNKEKTILIDVNLLTPNPLQPRKKFDSDSLDALVLLLRKTAYRDLTPEPEDEVRSSPSYRLGKQLDRIAVNHGAEKAGENRYAREAYEKRREIRIKSRRITGNMSFALLMLVIAVSAVFVYVRLLR